MEGDWAGGQQAGKQARSKLAASWQQAGSQLEGSWRSRLHTRLGWHQAGGQVGGTSWVARSTAGRPSWAASWVSNLGAKPGGTAVLQKKRRRCVED